MKRVALYIRVSTEEQVRHGLSLGEQTESLMNYAKEHHYTVVDLYEDAGISARKPYTKRPALLRLLDDCKSGMIDLILFIKLDRWFRNVAQYYKVQELLDQYRVNWAATQEDYETETASGRLKVNIMLSVAQDEADRTSERIKFVFAGKRAKGQPTCGKHPMGIKIENSHYLPDPEYIDAIQDMFRQYIQCQSLCALSRYMRETWGIDRSYNRYKEYIANRLYMGEAFGVKNALTPIVSEETFTLANQILAQRSTRYSSTRPDRVYLFSNLLNCAECGHRMSAYYNPARNAKYYRCQRHNESSHLCPHKRNIREEKLEDYLRREVYSILERNYIHLQAEQQKQMKSKISPEKIQAKLDRLKTLYVDGLIDLEEYKADQSTLKQQLLTAQKIRPIKKPDFEKIKTQLENYDNLTYTSKKAFWFSILSEIRVDNNLTFFVQPR